MGKLFIIIIFKINNFLKMSKEDNKILFSKDDDETQENIWDDTVLIRAYEKSVKAIRKQINSKLVVSDETNLDKKEFENIESDDDEIKTNSLKAWKVLDLCTAVYSEDGLIYPATIQEIYNDDKVASEARKCR